MTITAPTVEGRFNGMPDRDKVIKGLKCLADKNDNMCEVCGYTDIGIYAYCVRQVATDTLELLKEKEPKKPEWRVGRAHCPECGELFPKKKETQYIRFCSFCGQEVTWDE